MRCLALVLVWLPLVASGEETRVAAPSQHPALLVSEFIYEQAPFPECHASTVVESSEGILAAWFGGSYERNADVGIWTSRRQDGHWSDPVEVANGVQSAELRFPSWNPVLFQPAQGPLKLFFKVGPSPDAWWGMVQESVDQGRTWSNASRLPDGILGPIKNKPVQLASGEIVSPSSTEHAGWKVHFELSDDNGRSWTATPPIHDGWTIRAIQPAILIHPDGRLQALGRTEQMRIFQAWSTDRGRHWSELTLTDLPNPDSGIDAVTLKDGRHVLVYNHRDTHSDDDPARSPLNVAVSKDGIVWEGVLKLEDEPGGEFSYPAIIQARDGMIHIVYTWKRQRIKYAVLDPSKLAGRPIVAGKWID